MQLQQEVTEEWKNMHNEEPHNLYLTLNAIRGTKSRRLRCVGYTTCLEMRNTYRFLVGNLVGRDHMGNLGADRKIILKWI
jgi:hypothetical protein